MKLFTQILIEGIIVFTLVFLLNYFMFVRKNKKLTKDEMLPLELIYLSGIYGINPKLISFRKFQYTYSLINSFIITLTYLIVMYLIKTMIMRVVLGIVMLVLLIIICYGLLGRYYLYKEEKNKVKTKKKSTK